MIGVYVTTQVKPECKTEFLALIQEFIQESRTHAGCISYDCGAVNGETDQYCFIERWQSQTTYDTQYYHAYYASF